MGYSSDPPKKDPARDYAPDQCRHDVSEDCGQGSFHPALILVRFVPRCSSFCIDKPTTGSRIVPPLHLPWMNHVPPSPTSNDITPRYTVLLSEELLRETCSIHLPVIVTLRTPVVGGVRSWITRIWFTRRDKIKATFSVGLSHLCHPGPMERTTRRLRTVYYPTSVDSHLRLTLSFRRGPGAFMPANPSHPIQIMLVARRLSHKIAGP